MDKAFFFYIMTNHACSSDEIEIGYSGELESLIIYNNAHVLSSRFYHVEKYLVSIRFKTYH